MALTCDIVVPTTGRPSLARLLRALSGATGDAAGRAAADATQPAGAPQPRGAAPGRILLVDDRRSPTAPLTLDGVPAGVRARVELLRGGGRGPAAARNVGWRASRAEWIAFLDDDVVPADGWGAQLAADLLRAGPRVAGSQGRIRVPLPVGRRPTDWERDVAGLEGAQWATADLAYRRAALAQVGGFDERFRRAYREDADVALRIVAAGWTIARGERTVLHPVGPADRWTSVRRQAGNADDVLMDHLHGPDWRTRAAAPRGRARRHAVVARAGILAAAAVLPFPRVAAAVGAVWLAGTAELAWARIGPGPRTADEVATMAVTSIALPFAATGWRLRGRWRWRGVEPAGDRPHGAGGAADHATRAADHAGRAAHLASRATDRASRAAPPSTSPSLLPAAVLFDRDGTLVVDVPYNGDPAHVMPMPGALDAVASLRDAGVPTGVVSNQSGIARGMLTARDVAAVNARVEELLGPLGPWVVCPHGPDDGCDCRKPRPGLIVEAARRIGVPPERCAVIGDIGADVEAARAAGARGVLVPTQRTRRAEIDAAEEVAPDLLTAVRHLLGASTA